LKSHRKTTIFLTCIVLLTVTACSIFKPVESAVTDVGKPGALPENIKETQPPQDSTRKTDGLPRPTPAKNPDGEFRQWAISARASSEYSNPNWAAMQAAGEPDVKYCADNEHAWASRENNTVEWLELDYQTAVIPTEINIYQSLHPSQVVEVSMFTPTGEKYSAWEGYPEKVKFCPDLMAITVELNSKVLVNKIRITIDQQVNGWGWNEIDAVELVGNPAGK
jgi:hypothetical protein